MAIDAAELGKQLREWRLKLATEVGTEAKCPLCGQARVRRSDYIRCRACAVNWLDGEDQSRDPRLEREERRVAEAALKRGVVTARTGSSAARPAATSAGGAEAGNPSDSRAWRDAQAEKIRARLGMPLKGKGV